VKPTIRDLGRVEDGIKFSIRIQGVMANGIPIRERYTRVFESVTAARTFARARIEALLTKEAEPNKHNTSPTLEKFYDDDFTRRHFTTGGRGGKALKPSQKESIESHWRVHINKAFGDKRLNQITDDMVDSFVADIRVDKSGKKPKERKPKTVKNILTTLSTIFARAQSWTGTKMPKVKVEQVEREEVEFWSFANFELLAAEAKRRGPHHNVIILLGGRAGLRAGEILSLRWDDIDLARNVLTVRKSTWREHEGTPKSNKRRYVPIHPELAEALANHPRKGDRIIRAPKASSATLETLRSMVHACELGAGLKGRSEERRGQIHKLRHTFGAHLAMRGVSLRIIQVLMGHANYGTTLIYAHLAPDTLHEAVTLLGVKAVTGHPLLGDAK
jgi:integrase